MVKKLAIFASLLFILSFVLFVINQTAQVVGLVSTVNPTAAKWLLWILIAFYAVVVLTPLMMLIRLQRPLSVPAVESGPEFDAYLKTLGCRLASNPLIRRDASELCDRPAIEGALKVMDTAASALIKSTASQVFIGTAISQNGRLDTLVVLAAQTRMIWRVARIYNQRPGLADMTKLYGNVAATLFLTSQLEDVDIDQHIDTVVGSALGGSVLGLVPGFAPLTSLVMQSILDGTANAFLTLRVGVISQMYCGSIGAFDRGRARRSAAIAAAQMLGSIVGAGSAMVVKKIGSAARRTGASAVQSAAASMRAASARLNPFGTPGAR